MHCLNNIPVVCLCLQVGKGLSYWRSLALAGGWWLETADGWQREGLSALNGPLLWFSRLRSNKRKGSFSGTEFRFNSVFRPLMKFSLLSYPSLKKKILSFLTDRVGGERVVIFFPYCFPRSFSLPSSWTPPAPLKYHIIYPTSLSPNCLRTSRPFLILWRFYISSFSLSLFPFFLPLSLLHTYAHTLDGDFIIYIDDHSRTLESYSSLLLQ